MMNPNEIIDIYLTLGILMQRLGTSAYALTQTFKKFEAKYDLPHAELMLNPHGLAVSIEVNNTFYSGYRRFEGQDTNIRTVAELEKWLISANKKTKPTVKKILQVGSIIHAPMFFALIACIIQCTATSQFFGGDFATGIAAFFASGISFICYSYLGKNQLVLILRDFITALVAGIVGMMIGYFLGTETPLALLAASIIWLVPGLMMMNGFSDFFHAYTLSALYQFAQAVMIVSALLLGLAPVLILIQPESVSSAISPYMDWIFSGIASLACAYRFEARGKLLVISFLLGALSHGSRAVMILNFGLDVTTATLLAALLVGLSVAVLYTRTSIQLMVTSIATIGVIPLVPGAALLKSVFGLLHISTDVNIGSADVIETLSMTITSVTQVAVLAIGGILPTTLLRWIFKRSPT
ncbi:MAG: threonine/serine exporter family protein [Methylococcales bacterium]|nr:threonine/serine exporter family protein [Methylococcales bacterium]